MEKKEAMKILKDFYDKSALFSIRTALDTVFPELAEDEDERIRKGIIRNLQYLMDRSEGFVKEDLQERITWLEKQGVNKEYVFRPMAGTMIENAVEQALKQGDVVLAFNGFYTPVNGKTSDEILSEYDSWLEKQNPAWSEKDKNLLNRLIGVLDGTNEEDYHEGWEDKFVPWLKSLKERMQPQQFEVKDWVILNGIVAQILDKQKYGFVGLDIDGKDFFCNYGHIDLMRLWSIDDAKDGDILVNGSNIFIFHFINGTRLMGYCHVNMDNELFLYDDVGKSECFCTIDAVVTPATKKQQDLLFSKIKQAGYEWDAEKKELEKIEPKTLNADKVIAWLDEHVPTKFEDMQNYVKQFKKDFEL